MFRGIVSMLPTIYHFGTYPLDHLDYTGDSGEVFIRHRPPGPNPRIRLVLPSSGVNLASK